MSASGIYLNVGGEPVDLDELSWYEKPPCGCAACGVTVAYSDYGTTECPHEPRFGVPKRPEVEGYKWAAVHDAVSRPKLMHLVPDAGLENAQERRYGTRTAPLCGGKPAFWWSTEWYALDGKVECSRCWKKAAS